ncbi:MAG: FHA domain-containing protein [Gemmataceae bacterium]|nr:FHA domain-containing protein [Gemmataceae bacterium]
MSFKNFIYYCALCGGWAAFIVWALQQFSGVASKTEGVVKGVIIGSLLGLLLALVVGTLDALLNSVSYTRFIRVVICVAVGFFGSMIASLVGETLFDKFGLLAFKVVGWTIVGVVIGISIGIFDLMRAISAREGMRQAIRKIINGIIGGGIGGFIGGFIQATFGSIPIPWSDDGTLKGWLPRSSLALGLVILGMCIGLLIGLAQVLLKEAWVKVEQGFRAGRELILSKPDTSVGRAESCDIGLFGDNKVEKMHARIVLRGDRYMLVDVNTPDGTYLNEQRISGPTPLSSGDMIRVGRNVLRFEERAKRR